MTFDIFSGFQSLWTDFNLMGLGTTTLIISLIGIIIFSLNLKNKDKLLLTNLMITTTMILGLSASNIIVAVNGVLAVFTVLAQVGDEA